MTLTTLGTVAKFLPTQVFVITSEMDHAGVLRLQIVFSVYCMHIVTTTQTVSVTWNGQVKIVHIACIWIPAIQFVINGMAAKVQHLGTAYTVTTMLNEILRDTASARQATRVIIATNIPGLAIQSAVKISMIRD